MSLYATKSTKNIEDISENFDTLFDNKIKEIDIFGSIHELVCTNETVCGKLLDEDEEIIKEEVRKEREFKQHVTAALYHIRPDLTGKQTEKFVKLFKAAASTLTPKN